MLKLLVFAPCEKAILNQEDSLLTLVSIFTQVNPQVPVGMTLPDDAFLPLSWYVVALWRGSQDDIGKIFEQRVQVVRPDGREAVRGLAPIEMKTLSHQNVVKVAGFPVSPAGEHMLRISIREMGTGKRWRTAGEYPIIVSHIEVPVALPVEAEAQ